MVQVKWYQEDKEDADRDNYMILDEFHGLFGHTGNNNVLVVS